MSESTGGAGPALAAHSKDASAPGPNPASEMTAKVGTVNEGGEELSRWLNQATDFVRRQPWVQWLASLWQGSSPGNC
jgi:hypothetical protein